nr:outer membrane beta-barrel protein [uncultured Steroidobacter sp.]
MKRAIMAATLLALGSGAAYAQSPDNDEGLYLGGGVGQFNVEIDNASDLGDTIRSLDDDDTAWQAFIGWRLNPYVSLQAAYIDFGRPEDDFTTSTGDHGRFRAKLSGFAPAIIGTLPLGPVELSAKLGYYIYDLELSGDIDDLDIDRDDSGEDLMYGVGVGMTFFERLHAKLEYEKIDLENVDDANAFWLTGQWRF